MRGKRDICTGRNLAYFFPTLYIVLCLWVHADARVHMGSSAKRICARHPCTLNITIYTAHICARTLSTMAANKLPRPSDVTRSNVRTVQAGVR